MRRKGFFFIAILSLIHFSVLAQFNIQAPLAGHSGIHRTDTNIKAWATGCSVQKGWLDIADKSLGQPTFGDSTSVIGPVSGTVLSLGDSGIATLTFAHSLRNGDGPDFVVFENGFANPIDDTMAFLELAFVEVSSDGLNFFRFPAQSRCQDTLQLDNFSFSDARWYHNLAGKYISGFGTPFDLQELENTSGLNIDAITHVRIIDVVGALDTLFGSKDINGTLINDPYPTNYPSSGFDLSGVAVLHHNDTSTTSATSLLEHNSAIVVYPNPINEYFHLHSTTKSIVDFQYTILDLNGKIVQNGKVRHDEKIHVIHLNSGLYLLKLTNKTEHFTLKLVKP